MDGMCAAHAHVKRDRGGTRGKYPSAEKVTTGIYMEYICNRNRGKWFANRFIKNKKNKKKGGRITGERPKGRTEMVMKK